jgi:hypothetical protein
LTSPVFVGKEASRQLFEDTYNDYRRRVNRMFMKPRIVVITGALGGIGLASVEVFTKDKR